MPHKNKEQNSKYQAIRKSDIQLRKLPHHMSEWGGGGGEGGRGTATKPKPRQRNIRFMNSSIHIKEVLPEYGKVKPKLVAKPKY
jgi:hypothetical protein